MLCIASNWFKTGTASPQQLHKSFPSPAFGDSGGEAPLEMKGLCLCDLQKASGSGPVWVAQCRAARREVFGMGQVLVLLML